MASHMNDPLVISGQKLNPAGLLQAFDCLGDALIWIKDAESRYVWANDGMLLNFSLGDRKSITGLSDHDLVPDYLADLYRQDDQRVLNGTPVLDRIELVGGFDRTMTWQKTSKMPLRTRNGKILATLGISRPLPKVTDREFPVPDLIPAIKEMRRGMQHPINNESLARKTGLSVRAFERKFKKHFQLTPRQFFMRMRVTHAASRLVNTTDPIGEIAVDSGFSDQSHLSREFRRHFGEPPSKYRVRHPNHNPR
ncbi:MAG: helix-turn-helix domain-containing protein [Verrucomicrobiota bacterium]